jgi:two-component system, NtrC family, nitrogen regulation sensor histidine kinase NtrY
VTLRRRFLAYLLLLHCTFAAALTVLLWDSRIWLILVEAAMAISLLVAWRLYLGLFRPLEILATGAEFLQSSDFTTRLRETGQPEMDVLIRVYNRMADHLMSERISQQEQNLFLEKILSVSPAAIITFDYNDRISYANPAAESLLQLSAASLAGRKWIELPLSFAMVVEELGESASLVVPLRGVRKVRCWKSRFMDRGHPRKFLLIEELTEELRATEKSAYGKLIRMLSHEVNNSIGAGNSLLHSCLHYASQLRETDRADFEEALTVVISRTEHLNAFMRSFADIVKLPAPRCKPADLIPVLRNLNALVGAELAKRDIRFVWEISEKSIMILMDENQMEQVLLNIVRNAMEAIGSDGCITLRYEGRGRENVLVIEDTGSGISEDVKGSLFTPFFSTKENGQGIGLTLVQEILSRHGFEFSLESVTGGPTQFTIVIPKRN